MAQQRCYFAARSRKEIGESLIGKLQSLRKSNYDDNTAEYANALAHYYGKDTGRGLSWGVTRGGVGGKLAQFRINTARSYAKAFLSIATAGKVTWRPQARNGDASASASTSLGANLLEDLWENQQLAEVYLRWVEQAIVCSKSYVFDEWDRGLGPPLLGTPDGPVKQGDIRLHNLLPEDVKEDPSAPSPRDVSWRLVRVWKNKWDLAALARLSGRPLADGRSGLEAEDAILSASEGKDVEDYSRKVDLDEDLVPVWHFFHDKTPALPAGRETVFLSSTVVLHDSRLIYDRMPVHRLAADEMFGSANAWTAFWDMLGVQEVRDAVQTTLATIITTLGNPSLAIEQGSEIREDDLVAGFQAIRYPRGSQPPKTLQLAEFPKDALTFEDALEQKQRGLMGLDELSTGQFDGKELNAQAFGVLTSLTNQKASPFVTSCVTALGKLGGSMLATYGKRVTRERLLKITGEASANLYSVQRWTGEDLKPVDGVHVKIGNPMENTAAGRAAILETLMAVPGAVTTPEEVIQVAETGRLESATRAVRDELLLLKVEYESLQKGEQPAVHHLQNHVLHFRENGAVLYNPEALGNPDVLKAVNEHLDAHYFEQYAVQRLQDPLAPIRVAFLMGRQPDPTLMPPAPPMGALGPGAPAGPPPGPPGPPPPPELAGPPPTAAPEPPELPTDPMTGQPLELGAGAAVQ